MPHVYMLEVSPQIPARIHSVPRQKRISLGGTEVLELRRKTG